ncbi:hypothetical protein K2W90_04760 [Candidatus Babeliales bacterium]|nr:hypothetical protein [Candidatus Babeliales bacterium]
MKRLAIVTLFLLCSGNVFAAGFALGLDPEYENSAFKGICPSPAVANVADRSKAAADNYSMLLAFKFIYNGFNNELDSILRENFHLVRMSISYGYASCWYTLYQYAFECNNREAMQIVRFYEDLLDAFDRDEVPFERPRSQSC